MEKRKNKKNVITYLADNKEISFGEGSEAAIKKLMQKLYGKVEPKARTIEQIHSLWLRAIERQEKNRLIFLDVIQAAVSEKPDSKKGYRYMHFYRGDSVFRYRFTKERARNSFSYSCSPDCVDNDSVLSREEFIDKYMDVNDESRLAIGKKFVFYNKLTMSRLAAKVFSHMWRIIEESLRQQHKEVYEYMNKIITINISNYLYYVELKSEGNGYIECVWRGEVDKKVYSI